MSGPVPVRDQNQEESGLILESEPHPFFPLCISSFHRLPAHNTWDVMLLGEEHSAQTAVSGHGQRVTGMESATRRVVLPRSHRPSLDLMSTRRPSLERKARERCLSAAVRRWR